mmetsp:Transcript_47815/g.155322  ORF Transcript_47815/g.155322 Transcript_47815/m.155322 type:complete len:219 (+) Transcript_47815:63-719(+)
MSHCPDGSRLGNRRERTRTLKFESKAVGGVAPGAGQLQLLLGLLRAPPIPFAPPIELETDGLALWVVPVPQDRHDRVQLLANLATDWQAVRLLEQDDCCTRALGVDAVDDDAHVARQNLPQRKLHHPHLLLPHARRLLLLRAGSAGGRRRGGERLRLEAREVEVAQGRLCSVVEHLRLRLLAASAPQEPLHRCARPRTVDPVGGDHVRPQHRLQPPLQ